MYLGPDVCVMFLPAGSEGDGEDHSDGSAHPAGGARRQILPPGWHDPRRAETDD